MPEFNVDRVSDWSKSSAHVQRVKKMLKLKQEADAKNKGFEQEREELEELMDGLGVDAVCIAKDLFWARYRDKPKPAINEAAVLEANPKLVKMKNVADDAAAAYRKKLEELADSDKDAFIEMKQGRLNKKELKKIDVVVDGEATTVKGPRDIGLLRS